MAHVLLVAFVTVVLVALAVIDIRTRRLPNRIVLPATIVVLAAQMAIAPDRAIEWVAAALGASALLFAASLLYPGGLGMGDVKLALLLGAALGWAVGGALAIAFLAAGIAAVAVMVRNGWSARKTTMPLGPFLAVGSLAVLFF